MNLINKNTKIFSKTNFFFATFIIAAAMFPNISSASHACTIFSPSKTIKQGETTSFQIKLQSPMASSSFVAKTGDLPSGVQAGFSADNVREPILFLSAGGGAQIGSFGVVVVYAEDTGEGTKDSVCQLNINIEKGAFGATKSPDAVSAAPAGLLAEVAFGKANVLATSILREKEMEVVAAKNLKNIGTFTKSLSKGMRGSEVKRLQDALKALGFFPESVESTGYFGPITKEAVEKFQKSKGIEKVGIVGPKTRKALGELTQ